MCFLTARAYIYWDKEPPVNPMNLTLNVELW